MFAAVLDARIHQYHGSSCSQTMIRRCTRMHPLRWPAPHRDQEERGMSGLGRYQYRPHIKVIETYLADRGLHRQRNLQGQRSKRLPSLVGWRTKSSRTHRYLPWRLVKQSVRNQLRKALHNHQSNHTENTNCATTTNENSPWSHVLPSEGVLNSGCEETDGAREPRRLHRPGDGVLRVIMVVFRGRAHGGGCW